MTANILLHAGDNEEYRVRAPAKVVRDRQHELGISAEVREFIDVKSEPGPHGLRVKQVYIPGGIDAVSFQRPDSPQVSAVIVWLRHHMPRLGIAVDIDDDMVSRSPENTRRACALADVVTASSPDLAKQYGYINDRTFVIRSGISQQTLELPSRVLSRKRAHSDIDRMIGWTGRSEYLPAMGGALAVVVGADRTDGRRVTFRAVGSRDGLGEALSLPDHDIEASGDLTPYLRRVSLGEFDVGLVPEPNTLRVLEFAACGVPVIAVRTPEHEKLRNSGMPLWLAKAGKRREWVSALRQLLTLDDKELREVGNAHRENVRQFHSINSHAAEWATAWRRTLEN